MADQPKRPRRSKEEWRVLIDECVQSGMTQATFCKARGISLHSLRDWKHKLYPGRHDRRGRPTAAFVPVVIDDRPAVDTDAGITVEWSSGRRLRVPTGTTAERIAGLVHALEALPGVAATGS